jgi:transcriptional/translational regulatory protein YebC/TACO1
MPAANIERAIKKAQESSAVLHPKIFYTKVMLRLALQ